MVCYYHEVVSRRCLVLKKVFLKQLMVRWARVTFFKHPLLVLTLPCGQGLTFIKDKLN